MDALFASLSAMRPCEQKPAAGEYTYTPYFLCNPRSCTPLRIVKGYTHVFPILAVGKRWQQQKARYDYGIYACLAAMVGAVVYAFVRLYGLDQRVGADIIVVNVVVFTLSAGVMVYLSWKARDIEREEMFRD